MISHWVHDRGYYRCRFPAEYALANRLAHPLNISLREDTLVAPIDRWLSRAFDPDHLDAAIEAMADAQDATDAAAAEARRIRHTIADCDQKLARYRAVLEGGTDAALVAGWTAEVNAARVRAEHRLRQLTGRHRMTRAEIRHLVDSLGDMVKVLRLADPADQATIYRQLRLRLTYHPGEHKVLTEATPGQDSPVGKWVVSEGRASPFANALTSRLEFTLA
jgi:site-specific DNA recombinase